MSRNSRIWLAAITMLVLALGAGQVWLSHLRIELSGRHQALSEQRERLQMELAGLRLELASLTRPDRLRQAARALGMAPPRPGQVVRR